jgi:hypothetical protein
MYTLKMLATATAIAIVPVAANAAFQPQKEVPLGEYVSLECVIVKTSDHSRDADPIYKINVDLALTPRATPTSLVVEHVSANGRHYSRDEQYTRSNLTFTPGRIEYYWNGTMVRNSAYTMRGALWRTTGGWFYSEDQYRGGTKSFSMVSKCHPEQHRAVQFSLHEE